jgi:AraC family transcriptional activator FtrA
VISKAPQLDKLNVPGREAKNLAADDVKQWNENGSTKEVQFVHSDSPDRIIFEVQLEDLAKQEDLLTAEHSVRRLEFRANDIHLEGKAFPIETYGNMLLTSLLALLVSFYIDRRFIIKKKKLTIKTIS